MVSIFLFKEMHIFNRNIQSENDSRKAKNRPGGRRYSELDNK